MSHNCEAATRQQCAAEIIATLKKCAPTVLQNFPVDIAYLHGSVARRTPLPTSDVDVAVLLSVEVPAHEQLMLELKIQAALEDACHLSNLDVRSINHAPVMVQGKIVQEGVRLYSRNNARRVAFEVLTRKKYFDYRPTAQRMQQAYLERIRQKGLRYG
ncbi:MAG: nucleotidyltransferase domain-containing protein [Chloroflexi bacterium]|nr:MAG: nucleotidyltransferase domain-containing protein [Chloroflexota bacterium]